MNSLNEKICYTISIKMWTTIIFKNIRYMVEDRFRLILHSKAQNAYIFPHTSAFWTIVNVMRYYSKEQHILKKVKKNLIKWQQLWCQNYALKQHYTKEHPMFVRRLNFSVNRYMQKNFFMMRLLSCSLLWLTHT